MNHEKYMEFALQLAKKSKSNNEIPVGSIIVREQQIIGRGCNSTIRDNDTTAHAEVNAIRDANKRIGNYRLTDCSIYTTLEPCLMCIGAIVNARINQIFFGASDPKFGSCSLISEFYKNKKINCTFLYTGGIMQKECSALLSNFFLDKR